MEDLKQSKPEEGWGRGGGGGGGKGESPIPFMKSLGATLYVILYINARKRVVQGGQQGVTSFLQLEKKQDDIV